MVFEVQSSLLRHAGPLDSRLACSIHTMSNMSRKDVLDEIDFYGNNDSHRLRLPQELIFDEEF